MAAGQGCHLLEKNSPKTASNEYKLSSNPRRRRPVRQLSAGSAAVQCVQCVRVGRVVSFRLSTPLHK